MSQTLLPSELESTHRKPLRWLPWAVGLLGILVLVITSQTWLRHHPPAEDPLQGDSEEAVVGLTDKLNKTPEDQRFPLLQKCLQDRNPGLRYAAVDALGETHNPAALKDIENAFTDSASIVRQRAMEALPKIDRDRGLRLLLVGLQDEDKWIQEAAINQLTSGAFSQPPFVDRRAVPFLIQALDSPNEVLSTLAMSPLRKLTGQPWKIKKGQTSEERTRVIAQWKQWWQKAQKQYSVVPEFADIQPIRPTRSDPAPDFRLSDLDGKDIRLESQKGKVTLLNFWGSWCPPCQQEIPDLVALDQSFRSRGLEVVGIALNEEEGTAGLQRWCRAHHVTYRQALSTEAIQKSFGGIHEVPVSVLLDRQGRIRYRWEGERDLTTFRAAVERLLQENS